MPRYFFDIHDGNALRDADGTDLPDIAAARTHAMQAAASYAADPAMLSSQGGAVIVEVHDAARTKLVTIRLAFDVQNH